MPQEGNSATRAKNKYRDKTYDQVNIVVPKGRKAVIQAASDAVGESLNKYVMTAVDERIARQSVTSAATEAQGQKGEVGHASI